jgi:hypothetical protein
LVNPFEGENFVGKKAFLCVWEGALTHDAELLRGIEFKIKLLYKRLFDINAELVFRKTASVV